MSNENKVSFQLMENAITNKTITVIGSRKMFKNTEVTLCCIRFTSLVIREIKSPVFSFLKKLIGSL